MPSTALMLANALRPMINPVLVFWVSAAAAADLAALLLRGSRRILEAAAETLVLVWLLFVFCVKAEAAEDLAALLAALRGTTLAADDALLLAFSGFVMD